MDSKGETQDTSNISEVKLPTGNDCEDGESKNIPSNVLQAANVSGDTDNSAILKDTNHTVESDCSHICKTVQNTQIQEPMELATEDDTEMITDKCDKIEEIPKGLLCTLANSVDMSEATTSHSTSSSNVSESNAPWHVDQNKTKRSISKGQTHSEKSESAERSDDSSDEDSSKRQKLNKSLHETGSGSISDDTVTFQKTISKIKQRNYRKRQNVTSDNEDSSWNVLYNDTAREASILDTDEGNVASCSTRNESANEPLDENTRARREESEASNDGSDQYKDERDDSIDWGTANDEDWDEEEETDELADEIPNCLKIKKPPSNWCIIPEVLNRQIGSNPLFQRRFYGSLHAVERLNIMYKLNDHQGCVNALNFNQTGNLLASASDDLTVVIWDWARGEKQHWFRSGHTSNMFQVKWLPLDVEYLLVTCARDGQVRLLDIKHNTSKKLAEHSGPSHKVAVHHETPHVVLSAGEDARVYSIDIRERKPNKLLVVKEGSSEVQLYSIHSNPFNSHEFCVSGRCHHVRVYDRRKVSTPLHKLYPDHLKGNKHAHVTCAVYNYNGTEILASYNDEDIYLFDRLSTTPVNYAHRYEGHRNSATVKGVNFFGPKSEYVISGSDCGNIFIWDKNTEAVVQWMQGDKQGVVNCLEGHPHIPILATSGLDYDVKIWVPSGTEPPTMKLFANCVKSNARNRKQEYAQVYDCSDGQLFWILLRHIRHRDRVRSFYTRLRELNQDEDGDEDEDLHDESSNENSSENSDSQSESGDVGRIYHPSYD